MSSATASLEAALRYAELGYRVLPLKPNGKTPACEHGHKDATTDPETIRSWWEAHPERGVAVATGGKSGLTVVDLDTAEGHGSEKDGEASLAEWCKENDVELPETVACRTPSGGLHLYFSAPGRNLRNRTSVLPGVDVRGEGGYVVAPSTALPGGVYEWVGGSSPENVEPPPCPRRLQGSSRTIRRRGTARGRRTSRCRT